MTGKQTASTILPPFSGELRVDKELKLSHDNFKHTIQRYYANKQLSAIDQLKATPPFPTPHVFTQFASMAYRDCKHGDPVPPDGWQLLTTASHFGMTNGYFGAAYWHPEHQQVVIAHRGTKNVGAVVTDVKGVLFNNYVNQMSSASTFSNKIVAVLQEIEQEKKISFEMFFTGHSLGGWLAQITTLTTEYLELIGSTFLKKVKREPDEALPSSTVQGTLDVTNSYHPHTVVFDSPGCKDMLSQMADKLDVRLNGRSINLQQLDITSYLSAPNRINTCNSHVGTVYRIFTDLSDMGWTEKHTPLYNLETHRMGKIKKAFDPGTGQVHKDDKGRLKLLEVVDWPVSAGLTGGAELNDFFKWAEHLNNYHPEIKDVSHDKVLKGYHPLRYQTKAYDECTKSLSVFNEDQREFLERYSLLCQMNEFFKPEDLFCVMNNAEAEKEAEEILQNFQVGKDSFRCPDASTLHVLISYVKRLLRLFPHIKENIKDQLSSAQIRTKFYQKETQRYVERIDGSILDFKPGALGLRDFLTSDQQIWLLRMVDGDAWTGLTKVYRVLQNTSCTPNYNSDGHYTILKLKRLLTVNRTIKLNVLLASKESPHLLMIACGTNQPVNDELSDMFKEMFSILKQKITMKIILTTQSENSADEFIERIATETIGKGFIKTDEQLTWSDLTASSQTAILEKTAIFQGTRLALNQLTSAESITDSFPIADLLQEKELTIGEELVPSAGSGYNETYYIDRTFNHDIVIRQDILSDKREGKFDEFLASTEQEFKQFCQQNTDKNVHWLIKEKSGTLIWQQSQGNLEALREYIDARETISYAPKELDNLLEQAKQQRVMLIADKAGMGKTTILTRLSKQIKQTFPAHWLVRIDINDYTELLEAQKGKKMDKVKVLEFLSDEVLKLESHLEKKLFKKCFEGTGINKLVVMVDGFDEISPTYKETVLDMLRVLKQTSLEQLWVTTRPHLREELEDNLQQLSYTLQPFSEVEQVEFLKKFWFQTSNLKDNDQNRLEIYAEALIRNLSQSIDDKEKEFTGIPLQTRMLAEAFEEEFRSFYESEKSKPEIIHKLDLVELYGRFIDRKYNIYYKEKAKAEPFNMATREQRERDFKNIQLEHQLLALKVWFTEDQVTFLQSYNRSTFSDEELARIGIAQRNREGRPHFIHLTFAEYFVADFLINQLTKETKADEQLQQLLLNDVLLNVDCHVIRAFLNGLLGKSQLSKEALKVYGEKLDEQFNKSHVYGNRSALCEALEEDNTRIFAFLIDILKSGGHSNTMKNLLLTKFRDGNNALHVAVNSNSIQAVKLIRELAEIVTPTLTYSLIHSQDKEVKTLWSRAENVQITPGNLYKYLFLAQNVYQRNVWHVAAEMGSVEILDILWGWAKEVQVKPNEVLLSKDRFGQTAWHMAASTGHFEVIEKLWRWAEEEKLNSDCLKDILFLARGYWIGSSTWFSAVKCGRIDIIQKMWGWAKELQLSTDELKNNLFHFPDINDNKIAVLQTLWGLFKEMQLNTEVVFTFFSKDWYRAAVEGDAATLDRLWLWAGEEQLTAPELKSSLFLHQHFGQNVWHLAAKNGHVKVLEKLWVWAGEVQINREQIKDKLFLGEYQDGRFACHMAVKGENVELSDDLLGVPEAVQINADDIRTAMLLARDERGETSWQLALRKGHIIVLERLLDWAKEMQLNPDELMNELDQEEEWRPTWLLAAYRGNVRLLQELWDLARRKGNTKEIISKLLLARNEYGETVLHRAVAGGSVVVLEKIWAFSKEAELYVEILKKELLLVKRKDGCTAWHKAIARGNLVTLEILWSWAKETELNLNELLLTQKYNGETAFHVAVNKNRVEVLQKLLAWAIEVQLNSDELKNKLLLAKDKYGYTAWHRAAASGNLEALELLWCFAKKAELNPDELLLVQDEKWGTALHLATWNTHVGILETLRIWAEEAQPNSKEIKTKLLLAKDKDGYSAWHKAAERGNLVALEILWSWAKETELNPDELLLSQNDNGKTAFHMAVDGNHVDILEKIWAWAEETQLNSDEIKNEILLAKDKYGYTAWHRAAARRNLEALELLWCFAKEADLNPDELLLSQNDNGDTVFHIAVNINDIEVLQNLLACAIEAQLNSEELKNEILLAKDKYGYTAWHRAAATGNLEALELLWCFAKEAELNPCELLLVQDEKRGTALHIAAQEEHVGILEALRIWAEEAQPNSKEFKSKLLLAKDKNGYSAWHKAAERDNLVALEILWSWAKEAELNPEKLLLAQNNRGKTALYIAAKRNSVKILHKMWVWAEEAQLNPSELDKNLLLAKDNYGNITWHRANIFSRLKAFRLRLRK